MARVERPTTASTVAKLCTAFGGDGGNGGDGHSEGGSDGSDDDEVDGLAAM